MSNRRGFTLIELLVVIAIIGLLTTLAVTAIGSARKRIAECEARGGRDCDQVSDETRCDSYKTDHNPPPYCLKLWGMAGHQ